MPLSINYIVLGVVKGPVQYAMPGLGPDGQPLPAPPQLYAVTIEVQPDHTNQSVISDVPPFTINVPKEALAKYVPDAIGTIVFNEPA